MDSGESSLVIARNFQRVGNEEEVRALRQDCPAQAALHLLDMARQRAIRNLQAFVTGGTESVHRMAGLFLAASPVIVAVFNLLDTTAAVGQEKDSHHRAGRSELGGEAAAAQHFVVVMGRDDQHALGAQPLGRAGRLSVLFHWMYPRLRRRRSVSGSAGRRFTVFP